MEHKNRGVGKNNSPAGELTRREFLHSAGVVVGGVTVLSMLPSCGPAPTTTPISASPLTGATVASKSASSTPAMTGVIPPGSMTMAATPTTTTPVSTFSPSVSTAVKTTTIISESPPPTPSIPATPTASSMPPSNSTAVIIDTPAVNRTTTLQQVPSELLYTPEGIWIKIEADNQIRVGLTYHLYNIVTDLGVEISAKVRLLPVGSKFNRVDAFGTMENFKMLIDLVSPVSGTIVDTNIFYSPDIVYIEKTSFDMYGNGWMAVIKMSNPSELKFLLSPKDYEATYTLATTTTP